MTTALESERKFLIDPINSWEKLSELFENLIDIRRISQSYLKHDKDEPSPRVRKTISGIGSDLKTEYHFNQKRYIEKGVNEETEKEISEKEYNKLVKNLLPGHNELQKTRYVFKYKNQVFELDVFKPPVKVKAILEIELKNIDDKVDLPPFLKVIKEITGVAEFNNFNLAKK